MRLDHVAYRVKDRKKTAQFFIDALGYHLQEEFQIEFPDGSKADCIALEPPEKIIDTIAWTTNIYPHDEKYKSLTPEDGETVTYHLAPEIFVSDGTPNSIVGQWVASRGGIGGIHHLAYQVDSVEEVMAEWQKKGYAEFTSDKPLTCPGLTQVFSKPSELTGIIIEFIKREGHGFCKNSVKALMESTQELK